MNGIFPLILFFLFAGFASAQTVNLVLGNPSGAVRDANRSDNFLVARSAYVLSYNRSRGAANWVTWHLQSSDIGNFDGDHRFRMETGVPAPWRVNHDHYTNSGYDRGHMCPNKDRSRSTPINRETFVMSNVQPQLEELNGGPWKSLEMYVRSEVTQNDMEAYITAGCYGNAGRIRGKITIPTHCWKVILFLPKGANDLDRITTSTRVIAVRMPNSETIASDWRDHRRKVDEIENVTGYDLLSTLPDEIEAVLENRKDDQ